MVETTRRSFLKMLGVGAAVATAPNVFIAPELQALEIEVVDNIAVMDSMLLNYIVNDKIYPIGELFSVDVHTREPSNLHLGLSGNSQYMHTRHAPEFDMVLMSTREHLHNIQKAYNDIIEFRIPPIATKTKLIGSIKMQNHEPICFEMADGFITSYEMEMPHCNVDEDDVFTTVRLKTIYHTVTIR